MKQYGESIYGTRGNIISPQQWGVVTAKDKNIYLHILNKPTGTYLFVPGISQKIKSASDMGDSAKLKFKQQPEGVFVYFSESPKEGIDHIIQLEVQ
jgi:alpha-L-fucosidase